MLEFREALENGWTQVFSIDEVLFERRTEHQHLVIFRNRQFGRVLALDGVIQTTEADEFVYHEMLTHVPILAHGHVRRVLIVGGGDGGILREVLKHPGIERVTQVEIDGDVVGLSKQYLPSLSQGAYDDPRLELIIGDGFEYVAQTQEKFDVVVSDSTDPTGPGAVLFSSDFYRGCRSCLTPGGVLVTQNGNVFDQFQEVVRTAERLQPLFVDASFYSAAIPTYIGGVMAFAWASEDPSLRTPPLATLHARFAEAEIATRYYTPEVHLGAFALPRFIAEAIEPGASAEKRTPPLLVGSG